MLCFQCNIHACWSSETPWLCRCSCNKYVFWTSVTSSNTAAVQTCLLVKCCARWVLAGPLLLNQYACRSFTTQSCMLAGVVYLYLPYLLVWCLTISRAYWCDASLSAMPSDVLSHHRPCLLVCCLIIGHAFGCGSSLSTMPIGVVPHYRPCLLVSCHCNRHFY